MAKTPHCKTCNKDGHYKSFCMLNRKPIKVNKPLLRATKPIKKQGKHAKKWIETKARWLENHKAPYYFCHYCGKMMTQGELTLDHKMPRSRAPDMRYVLKNLVPCCYPCNSLKGSVAHDEYVHTCH